MREDEAAICDRLVTRETGFVKRLVTRFAILEVAESPAASRGIFS
jgi:hypothetical protein